MKTPTIDLIQVFCANFDCDLDLRLPPGSVKRFKSEVRWPDLDSTNIFPSLSGHDRQAQIFRLEIHLKRSRYSVEVLNLVLRDRGLYPHLEIAIRDHYLKTYTSDNFHPDMIVLALEALNLLPASGDSSSSIKMAVEKYEKWLSLAGEAVGA
jgi:hypothetical protein